MLGAILPAIVGSIVSKVAGPEVGQTVVEVAQDSTAITAVSATLESLIGVYVGEFAVRKLPTKKERSVLGAAEKVLEFLTGVVKGMKGHMDRKVPQNLRK